MKMMALAALTLGVCILTGCAAQRTWETVNDTLPVHTLQQKKACAVSFEVPQDAVAAASSAGGAVRLYEHADGDYEIAAQTIIGSSLDSVVQQLSGFEAEQLQILKTTRFGLPAYQFAWYTSGDEGGKLCRAGLIVDDPYCYAVTFCVRESCGAVYDDVADRVFASISLNTDEVV